MFTATFYTSSHVYNDNNSIHFIAPNSLETKLRGASLQKD